jgi:hypothetical protein
VLLLPRHLVGRMSEVDDRLVTVAVSIACGVKAGAQIKDHSAS